jgi:hypothetical protein
MRAIPKVTDRPREQRNSQSKRTYVYLCFIRFRSSENSMNSAKTQQPIKTMAIDATVQFISLSSIVMPPHDSFYYRQAGKAFNKASRITPAL